MTNGEFLVYSFRHGFNSGFVDYVFLAHGSNGRWYYSTYHSAIRWPVQILIRLAQYPADCLKCRPESGLGPLCGPSHCVIANDVATKESNIASARQLR